MYEPLEDLMDAMPGRMIGLLYDEAIVQLRTAIAAIDYGDIETRCNSVNRAMEIIANLYLNLDMERGGEIAGNLSHVYGFVLEKLTQVNLRNDPAPAHDAIAVLEPLRGSWHQLDDNVAMNTGGEAVCERLPLAATG